MRLLAAILIVAGVMLLTGVLTFLAMPPRLMYLNSSPFSVLVAMLGAGAFTSRILIYRHLSR